MNKKIAVVTGSDSTLLPILELSLDSKIKYANKHQYELIVVKEWDNISVNFADLRAKYDLRSIIGYLRAAYVFELLKTYNIVMWIDADAFITNSEYSLTDITDDEHCFYASYDWMHIGSFSTGNFIVKRHDIVHELYSKFIHLSKIYNTSSNEQLLLNHIYESDLRLNRHMKVMPHKYLNSVPKCVEETRTWHDRSRVHTPWTEDSFILHLTSLPHEERVAILNSGALTFK